VHVAIGTASGRPLPVEIRFIRSGALIQTFRSATPLALRWTESPLAPEATLYYRLEVKGPAGLRLLSNPIFVRTSRE
jgi:hypothetical protein